MSIQPYTIDVPDSVLQDLQDRLKRTRWTPIANGADWTHGISLEYTKELADHWQHTYDWRMQEAALNRFAHFKANIDGLGIHFIHEPGKGPNPTPLLLLHGFPDSFYRYHKVIDRLTDPAKYGGDPNRSFDVIVPSMPGTGFSDPIAKTVGEIADLYATLMRDELGYPRFVSAGGDYGSYITQALAGKYPELLIGMHLTDVSYPDQNTDYSTLSPAEMEMAQWLQQWYMTEGMGVNSIQATKPQTLAFGLNDSPIGLAAWLVSYASGGTKGAAEYKTRFSADEVLTNVMIYWVTETIYSAMDSYFVNAQSGEEMPKDSEKKVPAGVAHCPYDPPLPREWAARHVNLVHFSELPRGGHFVAWEEPELYANDLQEFVGVLRKQ